MKKLMQGFCSLEADYILIDVGAKGNSHPIDFFHIADVGVVATDPSRAALQDAYLFLKTAVQRKLLNLFASGSPLRKEVELALNGGGSSSNISEVLVLIGMIDEGEVEKAVKALQESSFKLIVNVASDSEGEKVSKAFTAAARQFLKVGLPYLGRIYDDWRGEDFSGQNQPLLLSEDTHVDDSINRIVDKIVAMRPPPIYVSSPKEHSEAEALPSGDIPPPPKLQLGLNEEAVVCGVKLHVQTEDLGAKKFKILTIVFRGGEVLYSKTSEYGDLKRDDTFWEAVMERVKAQHGTVITDIKSGMLDSKISEQWEVRR
jgi:MinD-like ATPase involved in chromosome partitioning or flagellar assembly